MPVQAAPGWRARTRSAVSPVPVPSSRTVCGVEPRRSRPRRRPGAPRSPGSRRPSRRGRRPDPSPSRPCADLSPGYGGSVSRYASVYPLVTARAVARPFTYEIPTRRRRARSSRCASATRGGAASSTDGRRRGARGRRGVARSSASLETLPPALVDLALWLADYYGSTPARALALVAPYKREAARRAALAPRRAGRSPPRRRRRGCPRRRSARSRASRRCSTAAAATSCSAARPAAARRRSTSARARRRSPRAAARSCSCPRSRSRRRRSAASARASATASRCCTPALTEAERRDERERIASGEAPRRRRRALGGVRAGAVARRDLRRRGARLVVQAGVGSALRRAHRRGEARLARGRGGGVRLGDAAAGVVGSARAARARRPHRGAAAAR